MHTFVYQIYGLAVAYTSILITWAVVSLLVYAFIKAFAVVCLMHDSKKHYVNSTAMFGPFCFLGVTFDIWKAKYPLFWKKMVCWLLETQSTVQLEATFMLSYNLSLQIFLHYNFCNSKYAKLKTISNRFKEIFWIFEKTLCRNSWNRVEKIKTAKLWFYVNYAWSCCQNKSLESWWRNFAFETSSHMTLM